MKTNANVKDAISPEMVILLDSLDMREFPMELCLRTLAEENNDLKKIVKGLKIDLETEVERKKNLETELGHDIELENKKVLEDSISKNWRLEQEIKSQRMRIVRLESQVQRLQTEVEEAEKSEELMKIHRRKNEKDLLFTTE